MKSSKRTPKKVYLAVLERSNGICETCHNKNADWRGVQMHHKIHRGMGGTSREEVHSIENIILICAVCHDKEHGIYEIQD